MVEKYLLSCEATLLQSSPYYLVIFFHMPDFKAILDYCKTLLSNKKNTAKQCPFLVFCHSILPAFLSTFSISCFFLCSCCLLSYFHFCHSSSHCSFLPFSFIFSFLPSLFLLFLQNYWDIEWPLEILIAKFVGTSCNLFQPHLVNLLISSMGKKL